MGLNLLGIPRKFDPRRIAPGALKAWYDASRIPDLADADAITVWPDLANPGRHFEETFTTALQPGWTNVQGTLAIDTGKGYFSTDTTRDHAVRETGLADCVVSCTCSHGYTGGNRLADVIARYLDANNFLVIEQTSATLSLYKRDGGTFTALASSATAATEGTDYVYRVVCNGNSVQVSRDGTVLITHTLSGGDTKYTAYTKHGILFGRTGTPTADARFDNFLVAKLTDAIQTTDAAKPTYKTNTQNGKPVVRFDGVANYLSTTAFQNVTARTVVAVINLPSHTATRRSIIETYPQYYSCAMEIDSLNQLRSHVEDGSLRTAVFGPTVPTGQGCIVANQWENSGVLKVMQDGSTGASTSIGTVSNSSQEGFRIGTFRDANARWMNGDIAEILIFNVALTNAQLKKLFRYLSRKWGIPLVRQVVEDTFTRADNALTLGNAETGQAWVAAVGTWGVSGGQAYVSASGGVDRVTVDSGVSDCVVQVAMPVVVAGGSRLIFRYTDTSNEFGVNALGTSYQLFRRQAGVFSDLGQYVTTNVNGDIIRVVLNGSSIKVFINGTERWSVTDTFNQTATRHGLEGSSSTVARFDNFTVEVTE